MKHKNVLFIFLVGLAVSIAAAGCTPQGPCEVTGTTDLTVYRLPIVGSDIFGTLPAGETHEVLARTADGWIGFDPGIAQAGNTGLARHRWIQLNATLSPFCLAAVDLVTLGDVEHDIGINNLNPPDLVITNVTLPSTQIEENVFSPVEVTVENQADGTSSGYEIFVFPHYDKGPQIPAGQDIVPDLGPGESHTFTFTPGVSYSSPGDYILRVLVTDNWNSPGGGPSSIGTNGDIEDVDIHVYLGLCFPFAELDVSLVLLNLPGDTRDLPIYLRVNADVFPGLDSEQQNGEEVYEFSATLGTITAFQCGPQGFPDRLYCMFNIPKGEEGTAKYFELRLNDCEDPVFVQANVLIPEPISSSPACNADLNEEKCTAAGGAFYRPTDKTTYCDCP